MLYFVLGVIEAHNARNPFMKESSNFINIYKPSIDIGVRMYCLDILEVFYILHCTRTSQVFFK